MSEHSISSGLQETFLETTFLNNVVTGVRYDIIINFLSAKLLPKNGADANIHPYFKAKIDDHILFTSTILSDSVEPHWKDEEWIVRNIPLDAKLLVVLHNRNDQTLEDDCIGQFEILNLINYHAHEKGHDIIDGSENNFDSKHLPSYTFDGPCRYSRHSLAAFSALTMLHKECNYLTWKIQMRRISCFFPIQKRQRWNIHHKAARDIFDSGPLSVVVRTALRLAHKILYGRTLEHNDNGRLDSAEDLWKIVFRDPETNKIKPAVYTYIIDDNTWRFSETGNQFFVDFASKHALLANGSEYVRYAGEFHLRPKHGWDQHDDDEWELVFDNASGTYSPKSDLLVNLKDLLEFNFPGLNVVTYDYNDPALKKRFHLIEQLIDKHRKS